jgi:HPt (histidine-containing phosphotransfer) domain-containing protein
MDVNNSPGFQFNDKLDIAFLNDLFEGDLEYATVVFGDFLKELPNYWVEVEQAYNNNKISELRSAVHKTKTLFGYVGHTKVLEAFQAFENQCNIAKDSKELTEEFNYLQQMKETAKKIIDQEYLRLKKYHQ